MSLSPPPKLSALGRLRRALDSVFVKLLLVILAAGAAVTVLTAVLLVVSHRMADSGYPQHLVRYAGYLTAELGTPPDPQRARALADKTGTAIHFIGRSGRWSTSAQGPPPVDRAHIWYEKQGFRIGRWRGRHMVTAPVQGGQIVFEAQRERLEPQQALGLKIGGLAGLALILAAAYLAIGRVLRPLRDLTGAVKAIGQGRLDTRLAVDRSDELGRLAAAFNQMTGRIRTLLQGKENLLLDISHELRSPLTRMRMALEFLPESGTRQDLLEEVQVMDEMVARILDTARGTRAAEALHRRATDLGRLLADTVRDFSDRPPGVHLTLPDPPLELWADPRRLAAAVKNVIENAVKFSLADSRPVTVATARTDREVAIIVGDDGVGIPSEELAWIFEPFYRVDKSRSKETGGFGLGLSLCHAILQAHGGRIAVVSPGGRGTTVTLTLPLAGEQEAVVAPG